VQPSRPDSIGSPPPLASAFQSTQALDVVERALYAAPAKVVVCGPGGVGKTQIAIQLFDRSLSDLRAWISGNSRNLIISGYAEAASRLGLASAKVSNEELAQVFLQYLERSTTTWLVVIDDLQDPDQIGDLWPPTTPFGRLLVTTRRRDASLSSDGRTVVQVDGFTQAEAHDYLRRRLSASGARPLSSELLAEADNLALDLGHLPMALAQAAAVLEHERIPVAAYRELLARTEAALRHGRKGEAATAHDEFRELGRELSRVLGSDDLLTLSARQNAAYWSSELGRYSEARTEFEGLLLDLERVLGANHPRTLSVRNSIAALHAQTGDTRRAVSTFEQLLADQLNVLGAEHPATLATRANLATWRGRAGDPAGAAAALEELVADQYNVLGPEHPTTFASRSNLAVWRGRAGDPAGAAAQFDDLVSDMRRVIGPDHPSVFDARANHAEWRGRAGDPAGAAEEFETLVSDLARAMGPDHPNLGNARAHLAVWKGRAGDTAGAAEELEALVSDLSRVIGPDHPSTVSARAKLDQITGVSRD